MPAGGTRGRTKAAAQQSHTRSFSAALPQQELQGSSQGVWRRLSPSSPPDQLALLFGSHHKMCSGKI